jgi:hypothetical protein
MKPPAELVLNYSWMPIKTHVGMWINNVHGGYFVAVVKYGHDPEIYPFANLIDATQCLDDFVHEVLNEQTLFVKEAKA